MISNLWQLKPAEFDYCFAIMRYGNKIPDGVTQLQALSPSSQLFSIYNDLKNNGSWNSESFLWQYRPIFLEEMTAPAAKKALNALWYHSNVGKTIQLGCSCYKEEMCHRVLVGALLERAGAGVLYSSGRESYLEYLEGM